jgi:hypothetical protein
MTIGASESILPREAGEGDHAKRGGGGGYRPRPSGSPLHRLSAVPLPRKRGRNWPHRIIGIAE